LLIAGVRAAGGIWTPEGLASYRVVERPPVVGHYRGWRVVSAAPPYSGGVLLVQMLNMLSCFDLAGLADADKAHLLVEVMRRAYRDRALYLGDLDAFAVSVERLVYPFYAAGLARNIDPDQATPSRPVAVREKGADTTHFSIPAERRDGRLLRAAGSTQCLRAGGR